MQVKVIEGEQIRVERKNPKKGQGKTLAVFSNRDGQGRQRAAAYMDAKRHTLVERQAHGRTFRDANLAEIEGLLAGDPWDPKGTALHESLEKFAAQG